MHEKDMDECLEFQTLVGDEAADIRELCCGHIDDTLSLILLKTNVSTGGKRSVMSCCYKLQALSN